MTRMRVSAHRIHQKHATRGRQIDADSTSFKWQQEDGRRVGIRVRERFNGSCTLLARHRTIKTHKMKTVVSNNAKSNIIDQYISD